MWPTNARHGGTILLVTAIALVAWGAVGLVQGMDSGFTGGLYDPEYRVPGVLPGGAAEKAGFKAGDRVISVDGIPIEELGMESRWPRSLATKAGQSRRFVVERNSERISIDLVYERPFASAVNNRIAAFLVGLAFLSFGLWAYLTVRTAPALMLTGIGFAAGVSSCLALGPGLGRWNGVIGHIATAASLLMYMLMLRFFVTYPTPKRVSGSRKAAWAAVGVWVGVVAFLAVELAVHPTLYYTTGSVVGPLTMLYVVLILAALVHTLAKTPRQQLSDSGMQVILGGFLIAIAWVLVSFFGVAHVPSWVSSIAVAAIPFSMAVAVRRQARQFTPPGPSARSTP